MIQLASQTHSVQPRVLEAPRARVLVVDPAVDQGEALVEWLRAAKYAVSRSLDEESALRALGDLRPEVVLFRTAATEAADLAWLQAAARMSPDTVYVAVLPVDSRPDAGATALRAGAESYMQCPVQGDALALQVQRAVEKSRLRAEATQLRARLQASSMAAEAATSESGVSLESRGGTATVLQPPAVAADVDAAGAEGVEGLDGLGAMVPGVTMAMLERWAIERTLDAVGGSTARAAALLGISQRKIQYRLKEWGRTGPTRSSSSPPPGE